MKETTERERKLTVGPGFELPPLTVEVVPRRLRATYYDTDDYRLARRGVTLRRRSEDGRDLWQLKLPSDAGRSEIECEADDSQVPGELRRLVTAYLRDGALAPVAELHTVRRAVRVTDQGGQAAEVVHDSVQVLQGSRVVREFDEVEIEQLADGSARHLDHLERQLRAAGAATSDGRPKLLQALDLPAPVRPRAERGAPPIEHLRAYVQTQLEALLRSDPATRRGDGEGVHGMRVATRRLRSALKEAHRQLDPGWVSETRAELKWLGGLLGEVRDPDVFAAYVERELEHVDATAREGGADLVRLIGERSEPARAQLAAALDSPRYVALLDRLDATRESLPIAPSRESIGRMLRRATRRARRKLRGASPSSTAEELHALRIASKRARYASELAQSAKGRPARRLAKRAAALQKILGEHQDAVVAEERLQSLVADAPPAAAFLAGRLAERQRERRAAARAALPRAARRFSALTRRV